MSLRPIVLGLVTAGLVGLALTSGAAGHRSEDSVFAGNWQTTRGPMVIRSESTVVDWGEYGDDPIGRVCGIHVFTSDSSTVTLSGLWYEGGPVYTPDSSISCGDRHSTPWGRFYFTISTNGKSFTGGFETAGDGLPIGNTSKWPPWTGTKVVSPSPPPPPPPTAQKFAVTVSGTGSFNPADARKNLFKAGSALYRMTLPRISLSASVRHNITVVDSPPKLLKGTASVSVTFKKISGSGRTSFPYRFAYRLNRVDDLDDTAQGQAFDFQGVLTSPKLSICKTFDLYSDEDGHLDFKICGVEGTGKSKTRIS